MINKKKFSSILQNYEKSPTNHGVYGIFLSASKDLSNEV